MGKTTENIPVISIYRKFKHWLVCSNFIGDLPDRTPKFLLFFQHRIAQTFFAEVLLDTDLIAMFLENKTNFYV